MKSVSLTQVFVFALFIAFGVLAYNFQTYKTQQIEINAKQDSSILDNQLYAQTVSSEVRLAREHSAVLAKSVLYLDSCQQAKTTKQDRAERRGKFIGGLLKGLFPGL
jgi:hypothetical protein